MSLSLTVALSENQISDFCEALDDTGRQCLEAVLGSISNIRVVEQAIMFFTKPSYLKVRRPSPTTVEFIVSNASSTKTISSKLFYYLSIFTRLLFCASTLVVLIAKMQPHFYSTGQRTLDLLNFELVLASVLDPLVPSVSWHGLIGFSLTILILCSRRFYTGKSSVA